ncbi:DUF4082 domain-containing protein [Leptodesmis sichuanensis A121]|nr:DUF4082 domain-containing protein [Leptodesmis sichuanensis A121]
MDANVSDVGSVMAGLQSDIKVLLDPTRDGIAQITQTLKHYQGLTGIDIISHGQVATIQLGNSFLSVTSLNYYSQELQQWAKSLAPGADILIYGCNVAGSQVGQDFIRQLSTFTGADVAASIDLTGDFYEGGNWTLEYATGSIETVSPFTTPFINSYRGLFATSFFQSTSTPTDINLTDGGAQYELGLEFQSSQAGQIQSIRYWKSPSETGTHVGKIWSSAGQLLASVTFTNETASGWQEQALATPLTIAANTTYVVSVNSNGFYARTLDAFNTVVTNGVLSTIADGSNGVFAAAGTFPTQSNRNSNYYRDIVFAPLSTPANNTPGTVAVSGTATQNQTLSATVADTDGLTGSIISYQWQQLVNNTWTNITGATSATLTLTQAQVGRQVRVNATYIDALGSSENILSTPTTAITNINDVGTVAIVGTTAQGNTLTATVTDVDGLPATVSYQWQQLANNTWTNITGATNQTLSLDSSLVGKQVRVNAIYTDVLGSSENIFSNPTNAIATQLTSFFQSTSTPTDINLTDGGAQYELGLEFQSSQAGQIQSIRYWKSPSETGTHVGKIWSSAGQLLASVTFTNETASGWQEQALATPLTIAANTTYVVSVNSNGFYARTLDAFNTVVTNGVLSTIADGSNGVFAAAGTFPTQSNRNSNYYRDIVFAPLSTPANNTPGTVAVSGTATQNQTLSATVADTDGLTGSIISYQWQQLVNNTWTNITGATSATLTLTQAQVGRQVRVNATYIDALGSSENILSTPTTAITNINDVGTVAIVGTTAQGNTLTATVTDVDGLPATVSYQWQQLANNTWTNITGATNQTLSLDSSLVGKQVRVNAIYTDVLGSSENIFSNPTNAIATQLTSFFQSTSTPTDINLTDGGAQYELGLEFQSSQAGQIQSIRYWKSPSETGTHVGKIWSSAGQLLASVTFTNETASGWQEQALATPLTIAANTTYVVSVNSNGFYARTLDAFNTVVTNGVLSTIADGSNGVFAAAGTFPTQSNRNSNYYRDIVFAPLSTPANNTPGTVAVSGTATQNQTLSATVADTDGLTGSIISYQWQQLVNNTWTNITGATSATLTLTQAQVGRQVRVNATYIDALGSSENILSTPTTAITNINDVGTVAIVGTTAQGNTLTATVTDVDGLPATVSYQWQQLANNTWTNITGATNQTLSLDSSLVGKQVRVNAIYTDVLGSSENIFSNPTNAIATQLTSFFQSTSTPTDINLTDGGAQYELGLEFQSSQAGQIQSIRYWKSPSETGTHVGKIWSSAGQLLASVTFTNETASGWQEQALATPLTIAANTTYVVSVNSNGFYARTLDAFNTVVTNGVLSTIADGSNGVFAAAGTFPTQSNRNSNYYRDIVFAPLSTPANNTPGTVAVSGTATQNQTLSATVADTDGLTGSIISYQWQQLVNNTWTNITGATSATLTLTQAQVGRQVRVNATYIDALGSSENILSTPTTAITNINDVGTVVLGGSATIGHTLQANIFDADELTGVTINYQWQQLVNNSWTNLAGAIGKSLELTTALLDQQVRVLASYIDALGSSENISSSGVKVAAQNQIVLENQKPGTRDWQLTNLAINDEIAGYATATSINKGEPLQFKVSLAQPGQYKIDIYRLGYYGGFGGRFITSSGLLNGFTQANPTIDAGTRLVEFNWNNSYTLQTDNNWTSGLYIAKLTDIRTGKETQVEFVVRDDSRPADIGFQSSVATNAAYNNYGGYSTYSSNSIGQQRAYEVSLDRPFQYYRTYNPSAFHNSLTWEYNMARWLESQGYDVSYYTNIDVHSNPLQMYSQKTFLSVGHDEYWSMEMFNNVEKARDNGINLAFFSANTAYWRVRFEPSSTGEPNRVMVVYKQDWALDPVAKNDISQATTLFRSPELNKPENSLLGVMYIGDNGSLGGDVIYRGFSHVVTNSSDPYYAYTGLQNGDVLPGLVGYEWDAVVNNGFTPPGVTVLSQSPVTPFGNLPLLPAGTNVNIANAVRYTAPSGAKVFSTGSIQWMWGLDDDTVPNPLGIQRVSSRVQQIAVNVFADMGAKPQTPSSGIVVV